VPLLQDSRQINWPHYYWAHQSSWPSVLKRRTRRAVRLAAAASNYSDNRYWTFYKLPMFGCNDSSQVLKEIANCVKSFPTAYIRLVAFDQVRPLRLPKPASRTASVHRGLHHALRLHFTSSTLVAGQPLWLEVFGGRVVDA